MEILFFNISGGEFMLVATFVLIFFGSKGLPEFARTFGRTIRQLRQATDQVKKDIESTANEVKHDFKNQVESVSRSAKVTPKPKSEPDPKNTTEPKDDFIDNSEKPQ